MKIRQSFVSNSSSTSYIILFPEGATADNLEFKDLENAIEGLIDDHGDPDYGREAAQKRLIEGVSRLVNGSDVHEYDDGDLVRILPDMLDEYVIASMDSGPDDGSISPAKIAKVKKILLGGGD